MTLWSEFLRRMMLGTTPTPAPGDTEDTTPPATRHDRTVPDRDAQREATQAEAAP